MDKFIEIRYRFCLKTGALINIVIPRYPLGDDKSVFMEENTDFSPHSGVRNDKNSANTLSLFYDIFYILYLR